MTLQLSCTESSTASKVLEVFLKVLAALLGQKLHRNKKNVRKKFYKAKNVALFDHHLIPKFMQYNRVV